ncbi:MAG: transcriptional regulator PtsJ, partial [Corynebacterium variabile]
ASADLRGRGWIVRDGGLFRLGASGTGAASGADTHLRLTVHELSDAEMDRLIADLVAVSER